jgi:alkanesulfonate monooxygenase SsuD/methylene tetrahydromethanopterin reductase-like flavin-dependent oxidoreductase (luciferase family)
MDHMTKGRVGWNIVTSYNDTAAKAMGEEKVIAHDKRYAQAHEYMEVMYS